MATATEKKVRAEEINDAKALHEPEQIVMEADYEEDRPVGLLSERQREFQKSLRGRYVDAEMPAA